MLLFVVISFVNNGYAHEDHEVLIPEEVSKPASNIKTPRIIILGNPDKLPQNAKDKLPTGYSWQQEESVILDIDSANPNDPRALFQLDDYGVVNVEEILEWAKNMGKEEVYLAYDLYNPDLPVLPLEIHADQLMQNASDKLYYIWQKYLNELFTPTKAYANAVGPPGPYGHPYIVPAGACKVHTYPDDYVPDNKTPSLKVCTMYLSGFYVHWNALQSHISNNIANFTSGSTVKSQVDCLKSKNGSGWIINPVDLTIEIYEQRSDLIPVSRCGRNVAACANLGVIQTPRTTVHPQGYKLKIWMTDLDRNGWAALRHEIMHSYGYNDQQTGNDVDFIDTCRQDMYKYF